MSIACGIDVGGTKIAGGVVDDAGTIVEELRVESPATDAAAIEAAIETLVAEGRRLHAHVTALAAQPAAPSHLLPAPQQA